MKLSKARIKQLAGLLKEDNHVPSFGLKNEANVGEACLAIAKAGVPVDMEYFMDVFYFNFKSTNDHKKALAAVKAKIDLSGEDLFA